MVCHGTGSHMGDPRFRFRHRKGSEFACTRLTEQKHVLLSDQVIHSKVQTMRSSYSSRMKSFTFVSISRSLIGLVVHTSWRCDVVLSDSTNSVASWCPSDGRPRRR